MLERVARESAERVFDVPHGPDGLETEADHAAAFNNSLGRTVSEIIFRGRVCISAKRRFPRRYESWVKDTLNCSSGYARKCMSIASNRFLANRSNWNALPHSTAALYELSRTSEERLQRLVEGGELHCKLTIDESVALAEAERGDYRPRRAAAPARQQRQPENTDGDADTNDIESSDAGNAVDADIADGDGEMDSQQLLIDAEDIGEELKTAFARCRRRIDAIETLSSPTAKSLLASELRDIAAALNYRADALDPPSAMEATEDSEPQADRPDEQDIESDSLPDDDAPWDEDMNRDDEPIAHSQPRPRKRSIPRVKSRKKRGRR